MKITAAQHVSAMLTSRQSPRGQNGYQTLFHTRELLSADEVRLIERRVQYSSARDTRAKWQSYRLTERRHVVTRIIPIPEPDEFGRAGRYFTHSLICDVHDERRFDASLFALLRPQNFLRSLEEVLASDCMRDGLAPAIALDAGREPDDGSHLRDWSGEELNRLYILMRDPRELTERGQYVALVGSEEQVLEALQIAFLLTPPAARKFCSFDTHARAGDSSQGGTFWGRGSEAAAGASCVVDASRRQVSIPGTLLRAEDFSPERLSEPLREAVAERLGRPSDEMLRRLLNRHYEFFIGEPVYQALLRVTAPPPSADDLELLSPYARSHQGLRLLLALVSAEDAARMETLAEMTLHAYGECVKQLRTRPDFKPWQAFTPVYTCAWLELFRGAYTFADLTTAITKVAEHGSDRDRRYLEAIDEHLRDPAEREALARWLKSSSLHFDDLQAALEKPFRESTDDDRAGVVRSFFRKVRHPLGG